MSLPARLPAADNGTVCPLSCQNALCSECHPPQNDASPLPCTPDRLAIANHGDCYPRTSLGRRLNAGVSLAHPQSLPQLAAFFFTVMNNRRSLHLSHHGGPLEHAPATRYGNLANTVETVGPQFDRVLQHLPQSCSPKPVAIALRATNSASDCHPLPVLGLSMLTRAALPSPLSLHHHRARETSSRTLPDFQKVSPTRLAHRDWRFRRDLRPISSFAHRVGTASVPFGCAHI